MLCMGLGVPAEGAPPSVDATPLPVGWDVRIDSGGGLPDPRARRTRAASGGTAFVMATERSGRPPMDSRWRKPKTADEGETRLSFFSEHGVTEQLSASTAIESHVPASQLDMEGLSRQAARHRMRIGGGLTYADGRTRFHVDGAADGDGGTGVDLDLRTTFDMLDTSLRLQHAEYRGLANEVVNDRRLRWPLRRTSGVEISVRPKAPGLGHLPMTISGTRFETESGRVWYDWRGRVSGRATGIGGSVETNWSHEAAGRDSAFRRRPPVTGDLRLRFDTAVGPVTIDGEVRHALAPARQWAFTRVTSEAALVEGLDLRVGFHGLHRRDLAAMTGGLTWEAGPFSVELGGDVKTNGDARATVVVRAGAGHPASGNDDHDAAVAVHVGRGAAKGREPWN